MCNEKSIAEQWAKDVKSDFIYNTLEAVMNAQGRKGVTANVKVIFENSEMTKDKFLTNIKTALYEESELLGEIGRNDQNEIDFVNEWYNYIEQMLNK